MGLLTLSAIIAKYICFQIESLQDKAYLIFAVSGLNEAVFLQNVIPNYYLFLTNIALTKIEDNANMYPTLTSMRSQFNFKMRTCLF